MNSRNFIVVLVAFAGQVSLIHGLNCNVCVVMKPSTSNTSMPCKVMPCNSMADVKQEALVFAEQYKLDKGTIEKIDDTLTDKTKQFVCVRAKAKYPTGDGSAVNVVSSSCSPLVAKFPPSDKPYPYKDYAMAGVDALDPSSMKAAKVSEETLKTVKDVVSKFEGEVYVCNEKIGNGPNCGEKAVVEIVDA